MLNVHAGLPTVSDWPVDPATERYVSLAAYRRNGREVRTPVWLAFSKLTGRYQRRAVIELQVLGT